MLILILGWGATSLIMLIAAYFYLQNWRQIPRDIDRSDMPPVLKQMSGVILLLIGAFLTILNPPSIVTRTISTMCIYGSAIIPYYVHRQLFGDKDSSILSSKVFRTTVVLAIIVVCLDYFRGDNTGVFMVEPFTPSFVYYAYWGIGFFIPLYLCAAIAWMFWKNIFQYIDAICVLRRLIGCVAFSVAAFSCILVEGGLLWHIFARSKEFQLFTVSYYFSLPVMGILLMLYISPQKFLTTPIGWVDTYLTRKLRKVKSYVHPFYVTAAPAGSRYRADELNERRLDAEIEQSRYIIWSHEANTMPITPEMDANLLLKVRQKGTVYHKVGICPPQSLRDDANKHILAVAKILRTEERKKRRKTRKTKHFDRNDSKVGFSH